MTTAFILYGIQEVLMTYVYKIHNPQLWVYMLYCLLLIIVVCYFVFDLEMMITRRSHIYDANSWFNGFIDL